MNLPHDKVVIHAVSVGGKLVGAVTREDARAIKREAKQQGVPAEILRMQYDRSSVKTVR